MESEKLSGQGDLGVDGCVSSMPRHRSVHRIIVVEVGDDHLTYGVEGLDYPSFHENPRTNRQIASPSPYLTCLLRMKNSPEP